MLSYLIYLCIIGVSCLVAYRLTLWQSYTSFGVDPFVAAFVMMPVLAIVISTVGILLYRKWAA